jgi:hypothetical protein
MTNLPTYGRNEGAVTAQEADTPLADFDDGLNLGASCAPGIGICTGVADPKLIDWSVADQFGVQRTPQGSQHIGITGLGDGSDNPLLSYDIQAAQYEVTPGVDDINDTLSFIEVVADAVDGQGMGIANADPINRTGGPVVIGDRVWGTDTVA